MTLELEKKLKLASSRAARLKSARDQAEELLELKSRELYFANKELEKAHQGLENDIKQATYELEISNKRLQKSLNERSTFIGQMSHEVRTPLNAIAGLSEILLDTELDVIQLDYIDTINSAARSLTILINDMLEITKIEAGKVKIVPVKVDSFRLHRNVIAMFELEAQKKNLRLKLNLDESVPRFLRLDKGRYKQILGNLISNAIRNTEEGEVFVSVLYADNETLKDSGTLTLKVQDTGVGIKQDQLNRIFNAYEQLGLPDKGVGLGLSICSQFAKLMNGHLGCESEIGIGSVFELSIPVVVISYKEDEETEIVTSEKSELQKLKILVAEDNPTNQKVISAQLAQLSQVADIVNNGAEAISQLSEKSYDLVLLDILMPIMDGEETLKTIRNSNARIANHYCVALTASSYEDQRDRLINLGFDEFLSKPLSMSELLNTLTFVADRVGHERISIISDSPPEQDVLRPPTEDEFSLDGLKAQFGDAAEMFFMEIAPTFLEQSKNDFHLLKEAIEQDRVDGIRRISHSIKGAALSMGLSSLAGCLEKIEHKPDSASVHQLFEEAENLCLKSASMIEALVTRLKVEMVNV